MSSAAVRGAARTGRKAAVGGFDERNVRTDSSASSSIRIRGLRGNLSISSTKNSSTGTKNEFGEREAREGAAEG
jgi:hypothetical protein